MEYISTCNDSKISISEEDLLKIPITRLSPNNIHIIYKNNNYNFQIEQLKLNVNEIKLKHLKKKKTVKIEDTVQQVIRSLGYHSLKSKHADSFVAPMPGLVLNVLVKEGDEVKKGDHLITLEAMKMENILKAAHDGRIKKILVDKTDKVEKNQLLLLFDDKA